MIDLKKAKLPSAVKVDGSYYRIHTSFKYWLRFGQMITDKNILASDFDFMYINEKPESRINGFLELIAFYKPARILPRQAGDKNGSKVLDYEIDADLIYSAFMEQYGIDLVNSDMHWYKFSALLEGLKDTKLNEVIDYRTWDFTGGKPTPYTRRMQKLQQAWALPENDDAHDEALAAFDAQLHD